MTYRGGVSRIINGRIRAHVLETYVLLPLFTVIIVFVAWLVAFHLIANGRRDAQQKTAKMAVELGEIYEAQMIRNLGAIDLSLKTVRYAFEKNPRADILNELNDKGMLPPMLLFTVSLHDAVGRVTATTSPVASASNGDHATLRDALMQDENRSDLHVFFRKTDSRKIYFSRSLLAHDGTFKGWVVISVDPAYFTSGYETSQLGTQGMLGLARADGALLVRRTGDQVAAGDDIGSIAGMIREDGEQQSELAENTWDQVPRYTNVRLLYGSPLAVVVGVSESEQLRRADDEAWQYVWVCAGASILLLAFAYVLSRMSWQLAQSEKKLRKDQETYYAASEASTDAVLVLRADLDEAGDIADFVLESANRRAETVLKRTREHLIGEKVSDILPQSRHNGLFDDLINVFRTGRPSETEWENDIGFVRAAWLFRQVVSVEDGVVVIVRDISERKAAEKRIRHMAHHDSLTGLPNRVLLSDRLQQALLQAQRNDRHLALLFIDLDGFKSINDTFGHKIGDELLKVLAQRLQQCFRRNDTVARLGGDEFVVLLVDQEKKLTPEMPSLKKVLQAVSSPVIVQGFHLEVSASIGVAVYPDHGQDAETLLANADVAMYQAKARGRNNVQFFGDKTTPHTW